MSTQPEIPLPPITSPLLYIAIYTNPHTRDEPDNFHWAFLVGPSDEALSPTGLLYTYTPSTTTPGTWTKPGEPKTRVWKYSCSHSHPLRAATDGDIGLQARLMIAEVADLSRLTGLMGEWSERDIVVESAPNRMSVEWVKRILEKLDRREMEMEKEGEGKGLKVLGRRMECFESVEAEGRQFGLDMRSKSFMVPRAEGQAVPTRVLFDRRVEEKGKRRPAALPAALKSGGAMSMKAKGEQDKDAGTTSRLQEMQPDAESETISREGEMSDVLMDQ